MDGDGPPPRAVNLAPFREDGFRRAPGIVDRHRGVVCADGVGTGKTETGMAFVEEYAVRRGRRALTVVPAQLVDHHGRTVPTGPPPRSGWNGDLAMASP